MTNELIWKKNLSLIRTFIYGYCEVLNVELNILLEVSTKSIADFCVIVSVIVVVTFSKRLTDPSCQDFSLGFWLSLAMVKTDVKNVSLKSLFLQI